MLPDVRLPDSCHAGRTVGNTLRDCPGRRIVALLTPVGDGDAATAGTDCAVWVSTKCKLRTRGVTES